MGLGPEIKQYIIINNTAKIVPIQFKTNHLRNITHHSKIEESYQKNRIVQFNVLCEL